MRECCGTTEKQLHKKDCGERGMSSLAWGRIEIDWPVPKEGYSLRRQLEGSLPKFIKKNENLYKTEAPKKKTLSAEERMKKMVQAEMGLGIE